jgi:hypothetical protein
MGQDLKNTSRSVKVSHKHQVGPGACARMVGVWAGGDSVACLGKM